MMHRSLALTLSLALPSIAACRTPDPIDEAEALCDCVPAQGDEYGDEYGGYPMPPSCERETCPMIEASSQEEAQTSTGGEEDSFMLDDPGALACALTGLRDRKPLLVQWRHRIDGGFSGEGGYVLIGGDGLALRRSHEWADLGGQVFDAEVGELESPEYFQACLDEPDERARFDCLSDALADVQRVCDVGWFVDYW